MLRYAVSRFQPRASSMDTATTTALDEAAFLILHTLHLPIDQLEPVLDARLTRDERVAVADIIEQRVTTRKPCAIPHQRGLDQGHSFYVDERVIVPRS